MMMTVTPDVPLLLLNCMLWKYNSEEGVKSVLFQDFVLKVYGWFCLGRPGFWTFGLFGRSWFLDVLDIKGVDVWAPFRSASAANPKSTILFLAKPAHSPSGSNYFLSLPKFN